MAAYQASNPNDSSDCGVWDDMEQMNDDVSEQCYIIVPCVSSVLFQKLWYLIQLFSHNALKQIELLCDKLDVMELTSLNDVLGGAEAIDDESKHVCVEALTDVKECAVETASGAERASLMAIKKRNEARKADANKARDAKAAKASAPWSKEEIASLAKGVKKYPPGGSNRWPAIALFINNQCKLSDPRTKDECIEKYNQIASSAAPQSAPAAGDSKEDVWSEEQDKLLQDMLRKYPASMDKNERWKAISDGVPGKSKKECVTRFKAIREAVKGKN